MEFFERGNPNLSPVNLYKKLASLESEVAQFAFEREDIENLDKFLRLIHKEQRNFNDTIIRAISDNQQPINYQHTVQHIQSPSSFSCIDQIYEDLEFDAELDSLLQDIKLDTSSPNCSSNDLYEQSVEENQIDSNQITASEVELQQVDENLIQRFEDKILDCVEFQKRAQGVFNNWKGFVLEFELVKTAPGVIAVSKVFNSLHQKVINKQAGGFSQAQVDVVCLDGFAWLEVKDYEQPFDVQSSQWNGRPRHIKGLKHQLRERIEVAQASCNTLRWVQPKVVVFLKGHKCLPCVQQAIQDLGGLAVNSLDELHSLQIVPSLPEGRNLDITTLCAMVSQVSYEEESERIKKWAQGNVHWLGCISKETEEPMLNLFHKELFNRPMIAAKSAVVAFEDLVQKFAGTIERQRWESWKSQIRVIDDSHKVNRSERIDRLNLGVAQKNVFGVGDQFKHITLTANTKAVKQTIAQGVKLETVLHRAVWLTGI